MTMRARLVAVATTYSIFTLVADVLPQPGVLTPPGGGFGIQFLWLVGALVAARRPLTAPLAWIVVLSAVASVIPEIQNLDSDIWILAPAWGSLGTIVWAHLIVAFPTGRLQARFDRRLIVGLYAYWLAFGLTWIAIWYPISGCEPDGYCPRNLFLIWPNRDFASALVQATSWLAPVLAALVVIAVVRHWRAATRAGRRILLPVVLAIPFIYVKVSVDYLAPLIGAQWLRDVMADPLVELHTWILPGAFLIGVIRAQLARGAVGDLAVRLGLGIAPGSLRNELARALGDPTLEVVFPAPVGTGIVDPDGKPATLPTAAGHRAVYRLQGDGGLLAAIVYDSAIEAEDPGRVERVAAIARFAIDNERLTAQVRAQLDEVQQSRARIVQAADDERRRVERDLHDGAQQRLVALAMRLHQARDTVSSVPDLVDSATKELQAAITEVRNLARGLYPTILTEAGLGAALEALAEQSTFPVRITAPDGRYSSSVEAAVYFVVAEALTNVARYAGATGATVLVGEVQNAVVVNVSDDGRGGADPQAGTGLRGLDDRVAALGGTLTITSPPGAGTTIIATFPIA